MVEAEYACGLYLVIFVLTLLKASKSHTTYIMKRSAAADYFELSEIDEPRLVLQAQTTNKNSNTIFYFDSRHVEKTTRVYS